MKAVLPFIMFPSPPNSSNSEIWLSLVHVKWTSTLASPGSVTNYQPVGKLFWVTFQLLPWCITQLPFKAVSLSVQVWTKHSFITQDSTPCKVWGRGKQWPSTATPELQLSRTGSALLSTVWYYWVFGPLNLIKHVYTHRHTHTRQFQLLVKENAIPPWSPEILLV